MHITSVEETYKDGKTIFKEGSIGDWIYIIESGSVELSRNVEDKKVVIEILNTGDIFGEVEFITKSRRTTTARAIGETTVGVLDRTFLDEQYNRISGHFQSILKRLARRLERTTHIACHAVEPRASKILNLQYTSKNELVKATSENLSSGGIFINTTNPLPQGERFLLHLFLPKDKAPLEIDCEVRWTRKVSKNPKTHPPGMGAQFINISEHDLHKLHEELRT